MVKRTVLAIDPVPADAADLRRAYGCFPSGVAAVGALVGGRPTAMAASSFTSVSIEPPLVSVCMQHTSTTWPRLRGCERLGVSVLAAGQDDACRALAAKHGDRFAGVSWGTSDTGALFVHDTTAWLECSVLREVGAGDHAIVLLEIHRLTARPDVAPLVFHGSRFHRLAGL